jgi:hypothetical protein
MKVVVKDANILLDLVIGDILGAWLSLGYQTCTTHLVWKEIKDTKQREKVIPYIESGQIGLRDIDGEDWNEIYRFSEKLGVSVPDGSVWFVARAENAILLSGDGRLRKVAKADGIEIRGVLWVLDELVARERLRPSSALSALTAILLSGSYLPKEECEKRMELWRQ